MANTWHVFGKVQCLQGASVQHGVSVKWHGNTVVCASITQAWRVASALPFGQVAVWHYYHNLPIAHHAPNFAACFTMRTLGGYNGQH